MLMCNEYFTVFSNYGEIGEFQFNVKNISELLAKRHNVTVYATNPGMRYPRFEMVNGVKVERFMCYSSGDAYFNSWEMLLRLKKAEFDIVHAFSRSWPHPVQIGPFKIV
ncbi:MAG: hypothetical protein QXK93_07135 [Candidatus Bathyarchaeia archaeon]